MAKVRRSRRPRETDQPTDVPPLTTDASAAPRQDAPSPTTAGVSSFPPKTVPWSEFVVSAAPIVVEVPCSTYYTTPDRDKRLTVLGLDVSTMHTEEVLERAVVRCVPMKDGVPEDEVEKHVVEIPASSLGSMNTEVRREWLESQGFDLEADAPDIAFDNRPNSNVVVVSQVKP